MRILAIRGKDLASLAGEFEIPLDADPLSTSGVFAVVGKTGAGKSTLLDALCLPLFDATPRLDARGGAPIGDEGGVDRYPANDVRNLVRKGATSAYAEVDFIGVDGHAYRARWEASRAYDKLDRELKVRALVFTRIDTGARVADGKKAVKQAIVDKLGLTFEQARRSMLLAQNEFARFLSASGDERAQLLEQITGTEIYSHLSRAAFERAREARTELEKQQARLGEDAPLAEEARAELETEVTSLRSAAKAKRSELEALEAAAAWRVQEQKLQLDLGEAKTDLAEAVRIHAESAELARDLEEVRAAERLRPLRDEVLRAQNGERVATQRLEDARAAVAQAEAHIEAHAPVLDAAKACAVEAQAALESARPSLHDARGLDAKLEPLQTAASKAIAQLRKVAEEGLSVARSQASLPAALARVDRATGEAEAWLSEHAADERLATQWDRALAELRQLLSARDAAKRAEAERERLTGKHELAQQAKLEAEAALTDARDHLAKLETLHAEAHDQRGHLLTGRDLDREEATLRQRETKLGAARDLASRHAATLAGRTGNANALAKLVVDQQATDARIEELRAEEPVLRATHAVRDRAYEQARASLALSDHRAELRPGEPCPLCGSEEHPYAAGVQLDGLVQDFRRQRDESDEAVRALERSLASLSETSKHQGEQATTLRDALAAQDAALERIVHSWRASARELGHADDVCDLDVEWADLLGRQAGLRFARAEVRRLDDAVTQVSAQTRKAHRAAEALRTQLEEATEAASKIERRSAEAEAKRLAAHDDATTRATSIDAFLGTDWRAPFDADAQAFLAEGEALATEWKLRTTARDEARERRRELDGEAAALAAELARLVPAYAEAREAAESLERQVTDLRAKRQTLFGGRPADAVEAELTHACNAAAAEAKELDVRHASLRETCAGAHAAAKAAEQTHTESVKHTAESIENRNAALRDAEITLEQLEARLARGSEWIAETQTELQRRADEVTKSQALFDERQQKLTLHHDARPDLDFDALDARREAVAGEVDVADQLFLQAHVRLEHDDARRARTAELREQLVGAETEARLWDRMKELIGSADGKRFRVFAQSLTLDVLLERANEDLARLHPRYQLQRVPGNDLELQVVDRDMGDSIRGIKSLSGGETFIASLALALGLASLTASRTTVETLFIDEGFGSLDPECLELVLQVLDGLGAQRRQVGVISHVDAIAERFLAQVRVEDLGGGRSRVRVVPEMAATIERVA